jgi:DNA-binding FadR family transcriptional regulator
MGETNPNGANGDLRANRVPKASDLLAHRLRAQILGNALPVGTELPSEAELIQIHSFSRSTIREALRLVEADGLIVTKRGPGGGIRVTQPDISQISHRMAVVFASQRVTYGEFFELRKIIEPATAAQAASTGSDEQRRRILDLATAERANYQGVESSVEFHELVSEAANNKAIRVFLSVLEQALQGHAPGALLRAEEISSTLRAHEKIAQAIYNRDADAASKGMLRHIEAYERSIREQGRLDDVAVSKSYWTSLAP